MTQILPEAAFPKLSDLQMQLVARLAEEIEVEDGEYLFETGDKGVSFFVIKSGAIEIVEASSGTLRTVVTHHARQFTGDVDLLTGRAVSVSGIAKGHCELLRVPGEQLRLLLSEIPELSDMLLDAFQMRRKLLESSGFLGIRVVGDGHSKETLRLREFFYKNHVPHTFFDIDEPEGEEQLTDLKLEPKDTPVIACIEHVVSKPALSDVAECLGISREIDSSVYDLVVVGAGPAGLAATVYGASEALKVLLVDRVGPGGQAGSSSRIENFIGFPSGISGSDLANLGYLQALKFGAHFSAPATVKNLKTDSEGIHHLELCTGQTAHTRSVLVATGVTYRQLEIEGAQEFEGSGVYYAATSVEARVCRNSTAIVVGGGNSAGQAAMYLAQFAKSVKLMIRGKNLEKSMSAYLCNRIRKNPRIEVLTNSELARVEGNGFIKSAVIRNNETDEAQTIDCSGLFSFIGARPHTDWLPDSIRLDEKGFVLTGSLIEEDSQWSLDRPPCDLETTCPGVMAAGDVRSGTTKRCGFAVGDGSLAIACVHRYLNEL